MIICPNCEHTNPEAALQCEACYTPLPQMIACPNCGASIQADATFCGQCGQSLNQAPTPTPEAPPLTPPAATLLQTQSASLLHLQTNTKIELPSHLSIIHLGKPNEKVPPDVDISGFPDSEVVSRVHGDIRVEEGIYYIEDSGSANGTYINHNPLGVGNRHRLRSGDRIALGKGDKVTFIFQLG